MGWRDREYARGTVGWGGAWAPRSRLPLVGGSAVSTLIVVNVAVYALCTITINRNVARHPAFLDQDILSSPVFQFSAMATEPVLKGQIWRLLTAEYLHWSFMHIFMNMLGLHFLGRALERDWGPKKFLVIYTIAGLLGMLFYLVLTLVGWLPVYGVAAGASGCVLGLLGACAIRYPHAEVLVYFLFPIRIRTAALIFGAMYALNLLQQGQNAGGDACHLAGLVFGAWWTRMGEAWWDAVGRRVARGRHSFERRSAGGFTESMMRRRDDAETIDRILKKVYEGGIHSLTESEKQALREATERQRAAEAGRLD